MKGIAMLVLAVALCGSTAVQAQDTVIEMLRADLRAERAAIIEEEMQFTEQEADVFWPVFSRYEAEIRGINDQRIDLIHAYVTNYEDMTDALAQQLMKKSLELDIKETYVRKKYFREFNHVLPAIRAAKFFQLDGLINTVVRAQIAEELPFVE